jgi:hypothetical protein
VLLPLFCVPNQLPHQRGSLISHESVPAFGHLEDTSPFHVDSRKTPPYTHLCFLLRMPPTPNTAGTGLHLTYHYRASQTRLRFPASPDSLQSTGIGSTPFHQKKIQLRPNEHTHLPLCTKPASLPPCAPSNSLEDPHVHLCNTMPHPQARSTSKTPHHQKRALARLHLSPFPFSKPLPPPGASLMGI